MVRELQFIVRSWFLVVSVIACAFAVGDTFLDMSYPFHSFFQVSSLVTIAYAGAAGYVLVDSLIKRDDDT